MQLNLLLCAPFGEYELELETDSFSDDTFVFQGRTSWSILNGYDEVRGALRAFLIVLGALKKA